jgi:zinc protease
MPAASSRASAAALKRLPNGLRYVVVEDHAAPVVSLQVYVRCGGIDEDERSAGVSHFLEHMIFKGTAKLSAGAIAETVETRGGSINAATGTEMTHYYIDVPSDAFAEAFDVLAESVLHPSFPPEEFEKERLVILEEIKRRNDNPQSDLWDAFLANLYRRTPYSTTVIGSVKTITEMTRDIMTRQHAAYYVPSNMAVVVVGDVKTAAVVRRIRESFGAEPRRDAPALPPLLEPMAESARIDRLEKQAQQAHVAVGFLGPTLDDPRQVAMDVLSVAIGGGNSSPLYQILREQRGSVWTVGTSFITHKGTGVLGVFAECPPEKARSLPNDIYLLLTDLQSRGFTKEETDRAVAQLRSSWLFSQETYHGQASQWGFYSILGRPELMKTYLKELDRVKPDDLRRLLSTYFGGRELSGAVVVPAAPEDGAAAP